MRENRTGCFSILSGRRTAARIKISGDRAGTVYHADPEKKTGDAKSPRGDFEVLSVLSFQRLALRVLEETGGNPYPVLEETGKTLVLQRVIQEQEKNLGVLSGSLKKQGTIQEMKSLVSELIQYDISPKQVQQMKERAEENPLLSTKLQDVGLIYQAFEDYLGERYITGEEVLDILYDRLEESVLMKNCQVILDGFTGFTPLRIKL